MVKLSSVVAPFLFVAGALAQAAPYPKVQVYTPSASRWWVAKSNNVLEWDCKTATWPTYVVLITNEDKTKYPSPLAVLSMLDNTICSKLVTQDQFNQPAGTGWQIQFANPINITDVYFTSDSFEIKPLGSTYPPSATPSGSTPNATGTGTNGTSATSTPNAASGAFINAMSVGSVGAAAFLAVAASLF